MWTPQKTTTHLNNTALNWSRDTDRIASTTMATIRKRRQASRYEQFDGISEESEAETKQIGRGAGRRYSLENILKGGTD